MVLAGRFTETANIIEAERIQIASADASRILRFGAAAPPAHKTVS